MFSILVHACEFTVWRGMGDVETDTDHGTYTPSHWGGGLHQVVSTFIALRRLRKKKTLASV